MRMFTQKTKARCSARELVQNAPQLLLSRYQAMHSLERPAMKTRNIDIPEDLLDFLKGSRLGRKSAPEQVKTALAIHLFLEGIVSIGKAAEL